MKIRNIIVSICVMLAWGSILHAQETLKIVTFNIRSFEPDFVTQPYADLLSTVSPDVVCLNEKLTATAEW